MIMGLLSEADLTCVPIDIYIPSVCAISYGL